MPKVEYGALHLTHFPGSTRGCSLLWRVMKPSCQGPGAARHKASSDCLCHLCASPCPCAGGDWVSFLSLLVTWLLAQPCLAAVAVMPAQPWARGGYSRVMIAAMQKEPCCCHSEHCWGNWTASSGTSSAALGSWQYWATQPLSYTAHTFECDTMVQRGITPAWHKIEKN